jgi:hypothetical protein
MLAQSVTTSGRSRRKERGMFARVGRLRESSDRRNEVIHRVRKQSTARGKQPHGFRQFLLRVGVTLLSALVAKSSALYSLDFTAIVAGTNARLRSAAFVLLAVTALGFLYLFNPATTSLYPTCPFFWATGCYCPGCGTLRALHQLLRGHLATAFGLNPLTVISLPVLGYWVVSEAKLAVMGYPVPKIALRPGTVGVLLILIAAYWVLRNLPFYPFTMLAP